MLRLGVYPTALQRLEGLSRTGASLWIKRDDQTNPLYGGNKVRKLEHLLADAKARGASRIVTVGAAGSHHVLATAVFARPLGLKVEAVIVPQPRSDFVMDNLRADLAQGVEILPAASFAHAAARVASRLGKGAYYIPIGGSNRLGAMGYVDAARELAAQVRDGTMPEPDLLVVALGSGGTAAGLAAGLMTEGLRTRVLGVTVAQPAWVVERMVRSLANQCAPARSASQVENLEVDPGYLGGGYGRSTDRGKAAMAQAATAGIALDTTYTSKAFAAALDRLAAGREKTILYWHTLSSASLEPLMRGAPEEDAMRPELRRLVRDERPRARAVRMLPTAALESAVARAPVPAKRLFGPWAIAAHTVWVPLVGSALAATNHARLGNGPASRRTILAFVIPAAAVLGLELASALVAPGASHPLALWVRFLGFAWALGAAKLLFWEHSPLVERHVEAGGKVAHWWEATLFVAGAILVVLVTVAYWRLG